MCHAAPTLGMNEALPRLDSRVVACLFEWFSVQQGVMAGAWRSCVVFLFSNPFPFFLDVIPWTRECTIYGIQHGLLPVKISTASTYDSDSD